MMALVASAPPTTAPARPQHAELDRATLARCQRGDRAALRAFVVAYQRPVFALLSRLLGRGPHVEDLAQETFLRAVSALPSFDIDGPARPSTWVLTIATRLALDARKRKAVPLVDESHALDQPSSQTPELESRRAELGRAIERAAGELGDDQRAVFVLAELHGLSTAEIAFAVGAPEATVKTRLFRAREKMRSLLGAYSEGV